jgi:hypothetical protein
MSRILAPAARDVNVSAEAMVNPLANQDEDVTKAQYELYEVSAVDWAELENEILDRATRDLQRGDEVLDGLRSL